MRNPKPSNSRKSKQQYQVLQSHFLKHKGAISSDHLQRLAQLTKLPYAKVYKWCWDQTKKLKRQQKASNVPDLFMPGLDEFGGYSKRTLSEASTPSFPAADEKDSVEELHQVVGLNIEQKLQSILSQDENTGAQHTAQPEALT